MAQLVRQQTPQTGNPSVINNGTRNGVPNGISPSLGNSIQPVKTSTTKVASLFRNIFVPRHNPVPQSSAVRGAIPLTVHGPPAQAQPTQGQPTAALQGQSTQTLQATSTQGQTQSAPQHTTHRGQAVSTAQPQLQQINGYPAVRIGEDRYLLLSMPILEHAQTIWEAGVGARLTSELDAEKGFRHVSSQPELLMVSDATGNANPCILLSVWDPKLCVNQAGIRKTVKNARKIVRKLPVVEHWPYAIEVIADETFFVSRTVPWDELLVSTAEPSLHSISSLMSLEIAITAREHQLFRLGGLIIVGQKVYGLTVAHPTLQQLNARIESPSLSSNDEGQESESSEDSEDSGSEGFLFDPRHYNIAKDAAGGNFIGRNSSDLDISGSTERVFSTGPRVSHLGRVIATSEEESLRTIGADWALVEIDDTVPHVHNMYYPGSGDTAISIESANPETAVRGAQVTIVAAQRRLVDGIVGQSNLSVSISGVDIIVTQIILTSPFETGYSGCWVVRGNALVGCIVAARRFLPIVYMVSISAIFDEITEKFGGADVNVATIELLALLREMRAGSLREVESPSDKASSSEPSITGDHREAVVDQHETNARAKQRQPSTFHDLPPERLPSSAPRIESTQSREKDPDQPEDNNGDEIEPIQSARLPKRRVQDGFNYFPLTEIDHETEVESREDPQMTAWDTTRQVHPIFSLNLTAEDSESSASSHPQQLHDNETTQPEEPPVLNAMEKREKSIVLVLISLQTLVTSIALTIHLPSLQVIADAIKLAEVEEQMVFSIFAFGQIYGSLLTLPLSKIIGHYGTLLFFLLFFTAFALGGATVSTSSFILFRFFTGLGGGGLFTIGRLIVDDVFKLKQRSLTHALLSVINILGKSLGPLFGASVGANNIRLSDNGRIFAGWQVQSAFVGFISAALLLCSTAALIPLRRHREESFLRIPFWHHFLRRVQPLRSSANQGVLEDFSLFVREVKKIYIWPFKLLFTEPIVIMVSLCAGLSFGLLFFLLSTSASLFREQYDRSPLLIGAAYLSFGLGDLMGIATLIVPSLFGQAITLFRSWTHIISFRSRISKHLLAAGASLFWMTGGALTYGWTATAKTSIVGPIFGQINFSMGLMGVHVHFSQYLVETFPTQASSVMSAVLIVSYIFEFGFPLFAPAIIKHLGYGLAITSLAVPTLAIGIVTCILGSVWGDRLRKHNRFARKDDDDHPNREHSRDRPEMTELSLGRDEEQEKRLSTEI